MGSAGRLGAAGFCAIAVSFGPARAGYGLFLPEFRDEFGLSIQLAGLIASGLQAGYLVSLVAVGLLVARVGPRAPILLGMLAAGLGMAVVAGAPGTIWLAAGIVVAGTSAGWSWAPYNDAVDDEVAPDLQGRVLSVISTGTTFGVLTLGVAAFAAGSAWRTAWLVFAATALAAGAVNLFAVPAKATTSAASASRGEQRQLLTRVGAAPLFAVALSFGAVSAFYWAFAVELVAGSANLPVAAGPLFYAVVGTVGFVGLLTGDAVQRFGLVAVLLGVLATLVMAAALLAVAPGSLTVAGASAALYGVGVMAMSSLLALWSSLVFAERPSTGFSVTLLFFGAGCVAGPAALASVAGSFGLEASFGLAAALMLITAAAALFPTGAGQRG